MQNQFAWIAYNYYRLYRIVVRSKKKKSWLRTKAQELDRCQINEFFSLINDSLMNHIGVVKYLF